MSVPKFVDVSLADIDTGAATNLKLKATVQLSHITHDGTDTLECRIEGILIGRIGADDADRALFILSNGRKAAIPKWPIAASVRTIKRDVASKQVSSVQARSPYE